MENEKKDNVDKVIENIEDKKNIYATGRVTRVNKYNIEVSGLNDVSFYEAIDVAGKASGYVMGIYPNKVIVSLVEIKEEVVPGDLVYALKKEFKCKFSTDSIGKVIDNGNTFALAICNNSTNFGCLYEFHCGGQGAAKKTEKVRVFS